MVYLPYVEVSPFLFWGLILWTPKFIEEFLISKVKETV